MSAKVLRFPTDRHVAHRRAYLRLYGAGYNGALWGLKAWLPGCAWYRAAVREGGAVGFNYTCGAFVGSVVCPALYYPR